MLPKANVTAHNDFRVSAIVITITLKVDHFLPDTAIYSHHLLQSIIVNGYLLIWLWIPIERDRQQKRYLP